MAMTVPAPTGHPVHHAPVDPRPIWRRPNHLRALIFLAVGFAFSYLLVAGIRNAMHQAHPWRNWDAVVTVFLIAGPLFWLVGLGAFDYWFRWAAGKPTIPEDHSGHGAYTWKDYFRPNTDHKVIGIQYTVHSFVYLLIGGMFAMLMRAELAQPGMQFVSPDAFNGLFSVHASVLIFLFIIPVFAGLANFVLPLMIGAPDMAMPLLVWANFSTSLLVVIATPFIAASQFFVLLDRGLGFNFFQAAKGGDVLMYQHVFWFYSHPAVYIMMLPGFGIISEVLAVKARKPIFGYRMMAFSLLAIVVLGFTVWAHHMFVSGMQAWIRVPMMITTAIIAVPTGIKVFSWLATLWRGVLKLDTPMLFALGFITMFTLGGISGVMLAMIPFTIHVSDTYFIVAHIHYVLFGGSLFTIFAGVYHWFPKMTGRMYDESLGKLHFWLTFIFFNATFGPMHLIGIQGMPRRVADYAQEFAGWNLAISISSFVLGLSTLIFVYNMVASWRGGPRAPANPWRALTLEWQVSSPPPVFNFDAIPTVVGGPYEYGVPGAVHGVFRDAKTPSAAPTVAQPS